MMFAHQQCGSFGEPLACNKCHEAPIGARALLPPDWAAREETYE